MFQPEIPNYITHYYEKADGPFLSMTENGNDEAYEIMKKLKAEGTSVKSKFQNDYVGLRINVEDWLRKAFIEKGGRPKRHSPIYTILGKCDWLLSWYAEGAKEVISLSDLKNKQVSFTLPDSMISYQFYFQKDHVRKHYEKQNKVYELKPYYGQVYLLEELESIINQYGLPKASIIDGKPQTPDMYIEMQIWEDL